MRPTKHIWQYFGRRMEKKELKRKGKKNMAFHSDLAADRCTELKPVFDPSRQYEKRKVVWDLFQCNMNSK